jgi:hypothetical protein
MHKLLFVVDFPPPLPHHLLYFAFAQLVEGAVAAFLAEVNAFDCFHFPLNHWANPGKKWNSLALIGHKVHFGRR